MNRRLITGFIILLFSFPLVRAQSIDYESIKDSLNFGRFRTIQISGHGGGHLYSGQSLTSKLAGYGGITARYGWQSKDDEIWGPYGYPHLWSWLVCRFCG